MVKGKRGGEKEGEEEGEGERSTGGAEREKKKRGRGVSICPEVEGEGKMESSQPAACEGEEERCMPGGGLCGRECASRFGVENNKGRQWEEDRGTGIIR